MSTSSLSHFLAPELQLMTKPGEANDLREWLRACPHPESFAGECLRDFLYFRSESTCDYCGFEDARKEFRWVTFRPWNACGQSLVCRDCWDSVQRRNASRVGDGYSPIPWPSSLASQEADDGPYLPDPYNPTQAGVFPTKLSSWLNHRGWPLVAQPTKKTNSNS